MRRLGKGGTLASRQGLVHSLVHIESWAVDLSWCDPTHRTWTAQQSLRHTSISHFSHQVHDYTRTSKGACFRQ